MSLNRPLARLFIDFSNNVVYLFTEGCAGIVSNEMNCMMGELIKFITQYFSCCSRNIADKVAPRKCR